MAALGAKPYQARREAADTLRVLATSVAASGAEDDAKRALAVERDAVVSALQVMSMRRSFNGLCCNNQGADITRHMLRDVSIKRCLVILL